MLISTLLLVIVCWFVDFLHWTFFQPTSWGAGHLFPLFLHCSVILLKQSLVLYIPLTNVLKAYIMFIYFIIKVNKLQVNFNDLLSYNLT